MALRGDLAVFGSELRRWRQHRRFSQEQLAERSEVSQRHLSFLENGRTRPSPEMIDHLARALDVPLRARNGLLTSAGFAPAYSAEPLESDAMAGVRNSLEVLVHAHEPYPAYVVDKGWNLKLANETASRLTASLIDPSYALEIGNNLLLFILHPNGARDYVANWEDTAVVLINRLRAECDEDPFDSELRELLNLALSFPGVGDAAERGLPGPGQSDLVSEIVLSFGGRDLRFYTAIMILSDSSNVTASELRLETLLPANAETEAALRAFASS